MNADPLFIDSPNGDYHLSSESLLRDAGAESFTAFPLKDFEGDPRIVDAAIDIGADEYSV